MAAEPADELPAIIRSPKRERDTSGDVARRALLSQAVLGKPSKLYDAELAQHLRSVDSRDEVGQPLSLAEEPLQILDPPLRSRDRSVLDRLTGRSFFVTGTNNARTGIGAWKSLQPKLRVEDLVGRFTPVADHRPEQIGCIGKRLLLHLASLLDPE